MEKRLLSIIVGGFLAGASPGEESDTGAGSGLVPGSEVTTEVFSRLDWIQGEAPKEWMPGKVYLFECWATWCGPCIAAIPHVNELHGKYESKGLRVYGIDVWEDGRDKVADFVKKKGKGMAYPVAYTGKGGAFETEWLKPAGVKGIPHTFVVRDGRIVLLEHPSSLTDELIEGLLAGGSEMDEALKELDRDKEMLAEFRANQRKFGVAIRSGDLETAGAALKGMKAVGKGRESQIHVSSIQWSIANEAWAEAEALLGGVPDERYRMMAHRVAATSLVKHPEAPQSLLKLALEGYQEMLDSREGPEGHKNASILFWRIGEKEKAIAEAWKAEEIAKGERYTKVGIPSEPYRKLAESLENGVLPAESTQLEWTRTAHAEMRKKREASENAKTEGK